MAAGEGIPDLADKLNHLFATMPATTRRGLHTNESASQALADLGVTVSGVHLSHLRAGRRNNPSARLLAALGQVFGVPIGYFLDEDTEDRINAELKSLALLRAPHLKSLMERAQGVSPESMQRIEAILDQIRLIEGLDPLTPDQVD